MKHQTNQFAAFVGIDWADQKHDISVSDQTDDPPIHQVIEHTPENISEWLGQLRQHYPDGQIAVCLEQSKGALIFHLLAYDFLTLFPINPNSFAKFRQAFTTSGAKGDPSDADLLREFVAVHNDRLRSWEPDEEQTRTIAFFAEARRDAVDERTRLTNRLRSTLKMYFPQAIKLVGDTLHGTMALDFLRKWPQLPDVKRAKNKTIQMFYSTHNSRSSKLINERVELIRSTTPLTRDQAVIKSCLIIILITHKAQLLSTVAEGAVLF